MNKEKSGPPPATRPFSIRLTEAERRELAERAGREPIGTFARGLLLSPAVATPRRRSRNPIEDHTLFSRVLAELGRSRLASNLNQLAKAVHVGALPVTPETEAEIRDACAAVRAMRQDLMQALGLPGGAK